MRMTFWVLLSMLVWGTTGCAQEQGILKLKSQYTVHETADRLVAIFAKKGVTLFARVDHAKGASSVGLTLAPTQLLIFGNPKLGTPLMQCQRTVALDLPQKALIWQDDQGVVWLGYNNPEYLKGRHQITGCDETLHKIQQILHKLMTKATTKDPGTSS